MNVEVIELHAFIGEAINVWGRYTFSTHTAEVAVSLVVSDNNDDVGVVGRRQREGAKSGDGEG